MRFLTPSHLQVGFTSLYDWLIDVPLVEEAIHA